MSKTSTDSRRDRRAVERTSGARRRAREQQEARRKRNRLLAGMTAVLLVLIIGGAILVSQLTKSGAGLADAQALSPAPTMLKVGSAAPDFTLSTIGNKAYTLSQQRGKVVLLEFFAVWCPHCQRESAILDRLDATYQKQGEQTLAVLANPYGKNYDLSGQTDLRQVDKSDITWFESTFAVHHPSLIDPKFAATNIYGANGYPTLYVVDRKGKVRYAASGEVSYATLSAEVAKALRS